MDLSTYPYTTHIIVEILHCKLSLIFMQLFQVFSNRNELQNNAAPNPVWYVTQYTLSSHASVLYKVV